MDKKSTLQFIAKNKFKNNKYNIIIVRIHNQSQNLSFLNFIEKLGYFNINEHHYNKYNPHYYFIITKKYSNINAFNLEWSHFDFIDNND
jgi:hypothetical protein